MDITIRGERAWVKEIKGRVSPDSPNMPQLVIWIAVAGLHRVREFGITLPAYDYTTEELKEQVEEVGGREWANILARQEEETAKNVEYAKRQHFALGIARRVAEAAGIELLEDVADSFTSGPEVTKHLAKLRGKEEL